MLLVILYDSLRGLNPIGNVGEGAAICASEVGSRDDVLGEDDIKGGLGIKEQDIQGQVGDMEGVEDALSEEDAAQVVGAARVHGLSGSPSIVPALAIMVHDVEIQSFGQNSTGRNIPITSR